MAWAKDIWRPAIVEAPIEQIIRLGSLEGMAVHWLPAMGSLQFLADPFGLWHDGALHVFVERYDYRDRLGTIEVLGFDADFRLLDRRIALTEPWHLSYPFVFEAEGEIWMLPESVRAGRLRLYRSIGFPARWEVAGFVEIDGNPVDATPFHHDGLWWLLYSGDDPGAPSGRALCLAYAERLTGRWWRHPASPVSIDRASAWPGGRPISHGNAIIVPLQDSSATYGGGIRLMTIDQLSPDRFAATVGARIAAPGAFAPFVEGLHTLAAAGPVTLIDVKRIDRSLHSAWSDISRALRRRRAPHPG